MTGVSNMRKPLADGCPVPSGLLVEGIDVSLPRAQGRAAECYEKLGAKGA
jgi:hypothetical protein